MEEYTALEKALMDRMTAQHRALMPKLSPAERKSLVENVPPEKVELIQSWIGSDLEIEDMLFWDRGGKFDAPEWQQLRPVNVETETLYQEAKGHYARLRAEAVESQRRSDLTLYSQFNTGLLFTGLTGAVRCGGRGRFDPGGEWFKGIEWRCIGSVEEDINTVCVFPLSSTQFEVHFGGRIDGEGAGVRVHTGDSYSLLQLAQLAQKVLPKHGFAARTTDDAGRPMELDAKAIRRAAGEGERLPYPAEMRLFASMKVEGVKAALEAADTLSYRFYERYGLETEAYKIGRKYKNFFILRDDNFQDFLPEGPARDPGLVLVTATLVCRRCRREIREFRDFARLHPQCKTVLVNLASPQSRFHERVFGDMGGGDPGQFRKTAAGVTPFVILYSADPRGELQYREYVSTGKAEPPPSLLAIQPLLEKYFL